MSKAKSASKEIVDPNQIDNWVDEVVFQYLNPEAFKSFFLFAGAGSGKTRTLVNVLTKFKENYGQQFRLSRKKVAIITYTNAAADEIVHRLKRDPIFEVSTIHSFAWALIKPFTTDIKKWLQVDLAYSIAELEEEQGRSRSLTNKTSIDRAKRIESKKKRLHYLSEIRKFVYSPTTDNITRDSLNHTEVISIAANFIQASSLVQRLLVSKFPILLIDESQDTKKELIDAFFTLQQAMTAEMSLGLFGDTMQRIYSEGKENLEKAFPSTWETPGKKMNHRSNKRIIQLINSIREGVDDQVQSPRVEKPEGIVRLFICNRGSDKVLMEEEATKEMAKFTKDSLWNQEKNNVKTLILEHHMAAKRMGFLDFFEPLYKQKRFATGVLDGTLSGVTLLTNTVLPLMQAHKSNDQFEVTRILKKNSPLFSAEILKKSGDQMAALNQGKLAAEIVLKLWESNKDPKIIEVLEAINTTDLFAISENIKPIVSKTKQEKQYIAESELAGEEEDDINSELGAWEAAFAQPFSQVEKYKEYLSEHSKFGTHQGVKGLEYPRVMVIIDDEESRGFMFSYDKLFGVKELTTGDQKSIEERKETGIDRTKRLFYVACSRAMESLAIVAYSDNPALVKKNALNFKWFSDNEIKLL